LVPFLMVSKSQKSTRRRGAYLWAGFGSFFGAGAGAGLNMLAQLFLTPSGITLEVTFTAAAAVEDATSAAEVPHVSAVLLLSNESEASFSLDLDSHADDSSVGTDRSEVSFPRAPLV
jgi:hypothetical protein